MRARAASRSAVIVIFAAMMLAGSAVATARASQSLLDYVGECVPFARAASGIQIYGDAWTWWDAAAGKYERGSAPRMGSVIVFRQSERLRLGHVAVVSRIITPRVILVTHANWSRLNGLRGHAERDVTMTDVSPDGDWSAVKVWYRDNDGLGSGTYPAYGFIHGRAISRAVPQPRPAPELTGDDPDIVGALIDVYR